MTAPDKMLAALRFMEMAADKKKLDQARAAFKAAHGLDLINTYHEASRQLEGRA